MSKNSPEMNRSRRVRTTKYFYFYPTPNSREDIDFGTSPQKIPRQYFLGNLFFAWFLALTWSEPVSCETLVIVGM